MFCYFCGKENPDNNGFCMFCGKSLHPDNDADSQVKDNSSHESFTMHVPVFETERQTENTHTSNKPFIVVVTILSFVLIALVVCLFIYIRSDVVNPFVSYGKGQKERTDMSEKVVINTANEDIEDKDTATSEEAIDDEYSDDDESPVNDISKKEDRKSEDTVSDIQEALANEEEADDKKIDEFRDRDDNTIRIAYVEASSVLNATSKDHATYLADNMIDGNYTTAWVEGVDGNGVGQVIVLHLDGIHKITRMKIYNGFLKTKRRYAINGKVASAMIDYGNGNVQGVDFNILNPPEEEVDFAPDQRGETEIKPTGEVETDTIIITILSAIPGSKYEDTAISEIEVFGE